MSVVIVTVVIVTVVIVTVVIGTVVIGTVVIGTVVIGTVVIVTVVIVTVVIVTSLNKKLDTMTTLTTDAIFEGQRFAILAMFVVVRTTNSSCRMGCDSCI